MCILMYYWATKMMIIKVPIRHHDHPARVHYCCVTGDRNLNCAVYTVSNVADDDANTYIYYTFIIIPVSYTHLTLPTIYSV